MTDKETGSSKEPAAPAKPKDPTPTVTEASTSVGAPDTDRIRTLEARNVIDNHVLAALGVGVVPIPFVDLVGVFGLQLHMLDKLSTVYRVEFSKELGRKLIASLAGGAVSAYAAYPLALAVSAIPVVGWTLGAGSRSILAGSTTYAVGHLFAQHFEKGGNLHDMDIERARSGFKEQINRGREWIAEVAKPKPS